MNSAFMFGENWTMGNEALMKATLTGRRQTDLKATHCKREWRVSSRKKHPRGFPGFVECKRGFEWAAMPALVFRIHDLDRSAPIGQATGRFICVAPP
jgi:hypothetical protein